MPCASPRSATEDTKKKNMAASVHPFLARNQSVSHAAGERHYAGLHNHNSSANNNAASKPPSKRRTKSFTSSEFESSDYAHDHADNNYTLNNSKANNSLQSPANPAPSKVYNSLQSHASSALISSVGEDVDHALHELFGGKTKPKGSASFGGLLTGLFSCWNPRKSLPDAPLSASKRVAALLEISKKQQFELANKQDTIDMLEWQLEQMQALESMEKQMEADAVGLLRLEHEDESEKQVDSNRKLEDSKGEGKERKKQQQDSIKRPEDVKEESQKESDCYKKQEESKDNNMGCTNSNELAPSIGDRRIATLSLFEMATVRARFSIRSFGKALIKQLEASGYSVLKTLMELEPNVVFTRKEHVVYALESRINKAFYHCFENDNFDNSGLMQILNPVSRCAARLEEFQRLKLVEVSNAVNINNPAFNEEFRRFCERKTRELWSQFAWSITFNTSEERDVFTAAFLDAAKGVWLLHRLAFSLHPHVIILRVGKGLQIDPTYVEAVPELVDGKPCPSCSQAKVEFLVVPGFHAMDKVIKCQVYQHIHC